MGNKQIYGPMRPATLLYTQGRERCQALKPSERAVRNFLATTNNGSWIEELPNGDEIEFKPNENGEICVDLDDSGEDTFRFRVRVELIEG